MRHQIMVSEETLTRLKSLAEPFVDREPDDVIRRLLDRNEESVSNVDRPLKSQSGVSRQFPTNVVRSTAARIPRERGVRVQLDDHKIDAVSVGDLYGQALRFLVENHKSKLQSNVPLKTSSERYLIAREPKHPNGNDFVKPVEFGNLHMESHKDYKNAIAHLRILSERLGLSLVCLG